MRSPTRIVAAATLTAEAFVVLFGGLVARTQSSLPTGTALAVFFGLAGVCLVAAGLVRRPFGLALGSVLQGVIVLTGIWVPTMYLIGGLFLVFWVAALVAGARAEAQVAARLAGQEPDGPVR